jgi:tetratricopeptide (TPR) repeat protein
MIQLKKISILFVLFISVFVELQAQQFDHLISEARKFETLNQEESSLQLYIAANKERPAEIEPLYKTAELYSRIGNRIKDAKTKEKYYNSSLLFAKKLLQLYPNNDQSHVALAIAYGRIALTKSGKEKVVNVKEIKDHAEKALKINPQNFKAWHILGKWHFEVSNLNFIESTAVKLFFGGLPNSSFKLAIDAYEKAKKISPAFLLNYLELAKAYKKAGQKDMAMLQLKKVIQSPSYTEDDPIIKKEASELLKEWQ